MEGELVSGMLAASIAYKSNPKLSMLVVGVKINFTKKAVGTIIFECNQGKEILATIQKSIDTDNSVSDDHKNKQKSVFSLDAMLEQKIEIIVVKLVQ